MKKILKTIVLVLLVMVLTGCMKMNVNVEVKADKSTTMSMEMLVDKQMLESYEMSADDLVEEMKNDLLSSEDMENAKVTPVTKTIDGGEWVGVLVEQNGSMDGAMINEVEVDGKDGLQLILPLDSLNENMGMEDMDLASMGYSVSQMKKLGTEMNITITMPNKVTSNVGEVNGNSVTIDLLELTMDSKVDKIVITSALPGGSGSTVLYGLLALIVVAGVILFFVVKNKKKAHQELPYDGTPLSNDSTDVKNQDVTVSYCPNCGNELKGEDVCPKCGFEIQK